MSSDTVYIHGMTPPEQERLARLNSLINDSCLREIDPRPVERALDVGCGQAQFTRALAHATKALAVGVDRDPTQLAEAHRLAVAADDAHWVSLRQGDAAQLPLADEEWGSFDLAHARFVLEHVNDPAAVVRSMVRALKPGGRIVLADDDHDVLRMWPEPAGTMEVWRAYIASYLHHGNDPHVGRKLTALIHDAGAKPSRSTWIWFGACHGHPDFAPLIENMASILRGARASILATRQIDDAGFARGLQGLSSLLHRPGASLWFAICWAQGRKP